MNAVPSLSTRVTDVRRTRRAQKAATSARRTLERELATYTSARDRLERNAILARYSDDETADIRSLLHV